MKPINRDTLIELYVTQGKTQDEIAEILGAHQRTIGRKIKRYKIPLREHRNELGKISPNWRGGETLKVGHVRVYRPEHPRAGGNGYVPRAVLVWEEANGLPFPEGKIPHHDNEIPNDDRPENIIPLTKGEHTTEHNLRRGRRP